MTEPKRHFDLVKRGSTARSPLGTATFIGLRALDGFWLQHLLLQTPTFLTRLLSYLHIPAPTQPAPTGFSSSLPTLSSSLTPYQSVLWAMSLAAALKQIIWITYIAREPLYPATSALIALYNTLANTLNTILFAYAATNPTWTPSALSLAIPLFTTGILLELVSELQRKSFKDAPRNAGEPYTGGLFAYARSINYFGYMLWRAGFALAGGGWVWGVVVAVGFAWDFTTRAVPALDAYCARKYGVQWDELRRRVPCAFWPGWW